MKQTGEIKLKHEGGDEYTIDAKTNKITPTDSFIETLALEFDVLFMEYRPDFANTFAVWLVDRYPKSWKITKNTVKSTVDPKKDY